MIQRRTKAKTDKKRSCAFCINISQEIDYKDVPTLRRYISSYGKIAPRHRTGACAKHQRKLANAIKTARVMAMLPFTIQ